MVHHYYKCNGARKGGHCKKKTVRNNWIEEIVLAKIRSVILDDALLDDVADRLLARLNSENTVHPLLRKQRGEIEKGIENLVNAIQMGILTPSTKERLDALEARGRS